MNRFLLIVLLGAFALVALAGQSPAVGSAAPNFRLQDQNGDWHQLSDYQGQWLAVYFYPEDETPGCTTEACSFRDSIYAFQAIGAAVIGISVDDVDSHKQFASKYKLPFTLLADPGGRITETYGALADDGRAHRESFLVNPEGVIVKHYGNVDPQTHTPQVLADIKMFQKDAGSPGS